MNYQSGDGNAIRLLPAGEDPVFEVPVASASHLASSTARVASPGPTAIVARTSRGEPPMVNSQRQKQKFWS